MWIHDREVGRVLIVDDEPAARDGYAYPVEELGLEPGKVQGPVGAPESFIARVTPSDVVVCDYRLKKHDYAACNGDVLVAECYKAGIPAVLCTTFTDAGFTIRRYCLRFIPVVLNTNSPEPETLIEAWKKCLTEMRGIFHPARKPWRTLVEVEEVDSDRGFFYVVVPAWDAHKKVRIDNDGMPDEILKRLQPGRRFHAEVNTGAESHEDLFFVSWESDDHLEKETPQTFADLLLAIPQDDEEFECLRLQPRPFDF